MPSLVLGLLVIAFSGWLAREPVLLVMRGVGGVAEVVAYEGPSACRGRGTRRPCHFHLLRVPGGETLRFDLGNPVPVGATLDVTWVPGHPEIAEPTVLMGPWWADLWHRLGFPSLMTAALGLFWTLWGVAVLWTRRTPNPQS